MSYTITSIKCLQPPARNCKRYWYRCDECGATHFIDRRIGPYAVVTKITWCSHKNESRHSVVSDCEGMTEYWKQITKQV